MADGRHFENRPNVTKFGMRTQILTQATEMSENSRNSQIQDAGRTPYWKSFLAITRLHIKTKFGGRRHNRTQTKVRCWKCQISKIQHGGRPPYWKSLYLHISAANRPNCTKFSMQTQILPQATETTKNNRNSQIQNGGWTPHWKSLFGYNSAACQMQKCKNSH